MAKHKCFALRLSFSIYLRLSFNSSFQTTNGFTPETFSSHRSLLFFFLPCSC